MFSIKNPTMARQIGAAALRQFAQTNPGAFTVQNRQCLVVLLQNRQNQNLDQWRFVSTTKRVSEANATGQRTMASPAMDKKRHSLPRNIVYRLCNQHSSKANYSSAALFEDDVSMYEDAATTAAEVETVSDVTAARPLVLLFAWMLSKDEHIEKYREMWTSRGYDILTVRTSPIDLLVPQLGGKRVAKTVYNFLTTLQPRYDEIIVHAFSVGGYQMGEFFTRLREGVENGEPEAEKLYSSFRGSIIDSCVFADDCAPGLSRAITRHPIWQPVVENSIAGFLALTRPITMARYYRIGDVLFRNERRIPGLLLFSKDDLVSNLNTNYALAQRWRDQGAMTRSKCWESSPHVLHYKEYPEEYESEIDSFVSQLRITKAPKC